MIHTAAPRQAAGGGEGPYAGTLRRLRGTFLMVGVFSGAINLLMLTGPVYMLQVYDRVLSSGSVATLLGLFLIVVVLYIFLGVYEFLRARYLSRAAARLDAQLGDGAFRHCLQPRAPGAHEPALPVRDLETVRNFVSSPAILGLFDIPWMPFFLLIVFFIHPLLGWLTLAGAAVIVAAALLNQYLTRDSIAAAMSADAGERELVEKARRAAEAIRTLGMGERIVARWRALHGAGLEQAQRGSDRSEVFTAFSKSFRLLLQSALLTMGAWLALQQQITPGMIIAASIIAARALAPVDQVIGQWRAIGRAAEAHRRLRGALDTPAADAARFRLPAPEGALSLSGVTRLVPGDAPVADRPRILDRVSFALEPGDGLGVVGNSASGKTTLARLIVGALSPDAGEVRLDDATLEQWDREELGRHIGYLPQTLELLPGSIGENIARFDPEAAESDIIEAARLAGIHEMILKLPEGYATAAGGARQPLSGGQIQRVGLARAIFGAPRVIVLDEPNANLDAEGDDALARVIRTMRERGSVVIVMAHRPSALAAVNKILVLHGGQALRFGERSEILGAAPRAVASAAG